ncbi:MAG TPA: hypothetical protein VEG44_03570 [Candidatus Acidoferrales bacterium]|nr:hypothetical protein [Candidatus Acidoferrales bacterium]
MWRDGCSSPWGNADFISGVKVNADAMARMAQLAQERFAEITAWD